MRREGKKIERDIRGRRQRQRSRGQGNERKGTEMKWC
jgi:hypothetical protein